MGRTVVDFVFADLPTGRRREVMSAVAHYIAGVLDRESMVEIVESLCEAAAFKPGDRVKTLRGSTHGRIVHLLEDGRVVWKFPGGPLTTPSPDDRLWFIAESAGQNLPAKELIKACSHRRLTTRGIPLA